MIALMKTVLPIAGIALAVAVPQGSAAQDAPTQACSEWAGTPQAWNDVEHIIRRNYAYLDRVDDPDALFASARASAAKARTVAELGTIAETLGYAFRDGHFHVRPAAEPERAWIPSSSDFWIVREGTKWLVADVKQGSHARELGIRPGWEVLAMDGTPIAELAASALAPVASNPDAQQIEYAGNVVIAGKIGIPRSFTFRDAEMQQQLDLPPAQESFAPRPDGLMQITGQDGIVRIRFNNSLGDNNLIAAFDTAMAQSADARGIIIDVRDTPGGGNTTVARAILGHFVSRPVPYQIHRNMFEETNFGVRRQYAEYVFPRGETFKGPVAVLAGRWSGSVGEALAMAFGTAVGAHTIGTPLADLLGDLKSNRLQNGCLGMRFAWDKLFAVDGTPREDWVPQDLLPAGDTAADGGDPALDRAIAYLAGVKQVGDVQ